MSLVAITRAVSSSINRCELSFHTRQPIDFARAVAQHQSYQHCLASLDARVVSLPAEPALPDAVFVEDAAFVVDELAVITNMGATSRRPEAASLANALSHYRPLKFLTDPATLDGGDVLRIERSIFVGRSQRTNEDGLRQLTEALQPNGYVVRPLDVHGCLHLKSACSYLGHDAVLVNRSWIDERPLSDFKFIDVPAEEPGAANVLLLNGVLIMPASFPRTRALLEQHGFAVRALDLSEMQKAEAGVTCCSLILNEAAK